jgi:hypothetical protein
MKTLNELYKKSCRPGHQTYKKITEKITLIDNFFEDFDSARNFFVNRDKWECTFYQENSKSGYETIFPGWVGKSLLENYIKDNKIIDDTKSYNLVCNFLYHSKNNVWSLSNSNHFPHIDSMGNGDVMEYVCLTNLNLFPVETKFYSFKGVECCDSKNFNDWNRYYKDINEELHRYYNKKPITRDDVKLFLDSKKQLDVKLTKKIQYNPNQAIVYPVNLFHSPNVTPEFSEKNPRVLLRVAFYQKTKINNLINYS